MAILTGYLPVEQGVACYTALRRHADTPVASGDERTRDQIMADTLVERITGQATAADVNVELQIMMPLEALIDPHRNTAATIPGYGPLPGDLARNILITRRARPLSGGCSESVSCLDVSCCVVLWHSICDTGWETSEPAPRSDVAAHLRTAGG